MQFKYSFLNYFAKVYTKKRRKTHVLCVFVSIRIIFLFFSFSVLSLCSCFYIIFIFIWEEGVEYAFFSSARSYFFMRIYFESRNTSFSFFRCCCCFFVSIFLAPIEYISSKTAPDKIKIRIKELKWENNKRRERANEEKKISSII